MTPENISNVSHYCDTNPDPLLGLSWGSLLKDPSLCWEQSSFVPVCFHLKCPLWVRLQYCKGALGWYFSSTMMVFVTNLLGKLVCILTSMPSDPGVPEGPGGPGWPWGPGGPLWKKQKEIFWQCQVMLNYCITPSEVKNTVQISKHYYIIL